MQSRRKGALFILSPAVLPGCQPKPPLKHSIKIGKVFKPAAFRNRQHGIIPRA